MIGGGIAELIRDNTRARSGAKAPARSPWKSRTCPPSLPRRKRAKRPGRDRQHLWRGRAVRRLRRRMSTSVGPGADQICRAAHSDLLLGSIAARDDEARPAHRRDGAAAARHGRVARRCSLVLRGPQDARRAAAPARRVGADGRRMAERAPGSHHGASPAFPDCPGHEIWKRDWTGSASMFSVILGDWTREQVVRFVEAWNCSRSATAGAAPTAW